MSQQQQMVMQNMGGPVGGPVVQPANANTPGAAGLTHPETMKKLNTAIYDYLLRGEHYEAARVFRKALPIEEALKQSPNQRQNQANGVDGMDVDSKEHIGIQKRPDDLPAPSSLSNEDTPFLQDWWCQFWELWHGQRQRGKQTTMNFIGQQRLNQKARAGMMSADPNAAQRGYMTNNGGDFLRQTALKNGMNQQQQLANMKRMPNQGPGGQMPGGQMERQGSQMDMNGPRSGSPNAGGDAPSPKRPRIDGGNMPPMNQPRPGQPGQMQGGNQVGPPSASYQILDMFRQKGIDPNDVSPEQLQKLAHQPTNVQAKSVEIYSQAMQQQMQAAMSGTNSNTSKGMPANPSMGPGGAQSSPMNQQGLDGSGENFYANRMASGMGQNGTAVPTGQQNNGGNHALQDYQMQLMLLEQQNKKRLLMARQEQDNMLPTGVAGPNGAQFATAMSPQGSRVGDPSPNPNDLQRGTPNAKKPGMSPNGDLTGRGSPTPGMMDPNMNLNMRPQMIMGPNGPMQMRPPSSHPMAQVTPQQIEMMRNNQMMTNGGNWQGPPSGQMMQGQPGGQPQNMTPRQGNMAPPPAPAHNPGGTQPSSPAQQPAPPTPSQQTKAKPGSKKEGNKKGAANKKNAAVVDNQDTNAPPTQTPPPPVTPNNPANAAAFNQNKNLQMPNNQQNQNNGPLNAPPVQPSDLGGPFGNIGGDDQFSSMDFAAMDSGDVLDNFDFDSFLNHNEEAVLGGFDANFAFGGEPTGEIDISQ